MPHRPKPLVLFVGAFPPAGTTAFGGNLTACQALLESSLPDHVDLVLLDSTQLTAITPPLWTRIQQALRRLWRFHHLLGKHRPDVVLLFSSGGGSFVEKSICSWYAKRRGVRALLFIRGGEFMVQTTKSRAWKWFAGKMLLAADKVLCQGESWRRFYWDHYGIPPTRCPVIANWTANPKHLAIGRARRYVGQAPARMLFLSRLDYGKGIRETLFAFKSLVHTCPETPVELLIAGEGEASEWARAWVHQAGLASQVKFLGWVADDAKTAVLSEADWFVLPSYAEGLPNSMIEAMAVGLPVIVTPVGSISDAVADGQEGLIVPPRDVPRLAEAMRRMATDVRLRERLGQAAATRASRDFTVERAVEQLISVICEKLPAITASRGSNQIAPTASADLSRH